MNAQHVNGMTRFEKSGEIHARLLGKLEKNKTHNYFSWEVVTVSTFEVASWRTDVGSNPITYFICIAFILGKLESPKIWILKAYFFNVLFESLNVWLHQEKWGKKSSMIRKHKLLKSAVAKGFLILITNFGWQDWVECTIFPLCRPKWDFGALKNEKTRWKMASFHTIRRIFLLL